MRLTSLVMAFAMIALFGAPEAQASRYLGEDGGSMYGRAAPDQYLRPGQRQTYSQSARRHKSHSSRRYTSRSTHRTRRYAGRHSVGGRPRKWCGWWMRTQLGGGPEFNRAAHWRNYGRPSVAQVGAVVVWPHHVGIITGRASNGRWIVKSGNDGGRVRERPRSVAGAVFRVG